MKDCLDYTKPDLAFGIALRANRSFLIFNFFKVSLDTFRLAGKCTDFDTYLQVNHHW